jgi:hypothetical protein|nr:MAG TPA: hypothetical protein [Caudoviricetes sp.]
MTYILAGITGICALICAAELLVRLADSTGVMDKLFRLFDLSGEKESAPNAATSEGTKVIYIGDIIPQYAEAVKEEVK